jgi:hypothetical protein
MLKINEKEVEVEINKENNSKIYKFFACSCKEKDEDYYRDLLRKEFPFKKEEKRKKDRMLTTHLIHMLAGEDWEVYSIYPDQWIMMVLKHIETKDEMHIQCDYVEFGLLTAFKIAEDLNKT